MAGCFGVFGQLAKGVCRETLLNSIDKLNLGTSNLVSINDEAILGASWLKNAPISEPHSYETPKWAIVIAGDPITTDSKSILKEIPWQQIIETIENRDFRTFINWRGSFSICAFDKHNNTVWIIADQKAQMPLFYYHTKSGICVSTDMSTFCKIPSIKPKLNREWLYDFLFFNFGLFGATFLDNVRSMLPSTVLEYSLATGEYTLSKYADLCKKNENLLSGKEAYKHAVDVFHAVMPRYYTGADHYAVPLTAGWDGRTVFAFRPDNESVTSYTYGVPCCEDLVEAAYTAQKIGVEHISIEFDKQYLDNIEAYIHLAVWLSSGLQHIGRSTLTYVYNKLTQSATRYPVTLSGISGDMQFRGHGYTPSIISYGMKPIFWTGKPDINDEPWQSLLGKHISSFRDYIELGLGKLQEAYGPFDSTEHHLSYLIYEVACKHFAGELAIANQYTVWRTPYLDDDIVKLSYDIWESTLKFSNFTPATVNKKGEDILDGLLISGVDPKLAKIHVRGVPPSAAGKGYLPSLVYKLIFRGPVKLTKKWDKTPLEDWDKWLYAELAPTVQRLLYSNDSRISEYLDPHGLKAIDEVHKRSHFTMRFITAEIILRLIENNWEMPEEVSFLLHCNNKD